MKLLYLFFFIAMSIINTIYGQVDIMYEKFELPKKVKETSGLIYFDGHLITHNDSGDEPFLYEIDTLSGEIIRRVKIINAKNHDWEDITQDKTFIYIGDIGNNNGDRDDLGIYKISKEQFLNNDELLASYISYQYEDQIDFTDNHHNTNFDAEGLTVHGDSLYIFTKNWLDYETNVYVVPKTSGNHIAHKIDNYNIGGLITGACYNEDENTYTLSAYKNSLSPFIIKLSGFSGRTVFDGQITITEVDLFIGMGSQTEGVTWVKDDHYFLSREKYKIYIGDEKITFKQKLYGFHQKKNPNNTTSALKSIDVMIYPNPVKNIIHIEMQEPSISIANVLLYNTIGQQIPIKPQLVNQTIELNHLPKGVLFLKLVFSNNKHQVYKIVSY